MVILGDCDSWVDEHGHFGIAMHPGREPIGSPVGRFEFFFCTTVLCGECAAVYHVISKEAIERAFGSGFQVKPFHIVPGQRDLLLALVSEKRGEHISKNPYATTWTFDVPCPKCGKELFTKEILLVRSMGREKNKYYGFAPVKEGDAVITCPRCKAGTIEYKGSSTY